MKRAVTLCAVAVALYLTVYIVYRARHVQVWAGDGKAYVILGSRLTWYGYRPLSYVDARVTGMRFHLGPRRDTPQAVLDRAIAAAGGAGRLDALRAFMWNGRADAAIGERTLHLTGSWRLQLPDSVIVTTTLEGQPPASARSLIIAGKRGWTKVNGAVTPLAPELLAHERDQFYLYHLMRLVPAQGKGFRLSRLEDDSLGHPRLRVSRTGRPDVDLSFDAAGNLAGLADSVTDPLSHARVRQEVTLSGQLQVAGVRWPRRITITWNGKPYFDLEIIDVRSLAQLVDPALRGPVPAPRRSVKRAPSSRIRKH